MAFDQEIFVALAKAAHQAAQVPGFDPDPENELAVKQVARSIAEATRRAAVHQIAMAISQRVEDLWPGPSPDAEKPAVGSLDEVAFAAIAFYNATIQE